MQMHSNPGPGLDPEPDPPNTTVTPTTTMTILGALSQSRQGRAAMLGALPSAALKIFVYLRVCDPDCDCDRDRDRNSKPYNPHQPILNPILTPP